MGIMADLEVGNPYLASRREWDERYGDLITRARNWRASTFLSLAGNLALVIGLVVVSGRAHLVPYVVVVDKDHHLMGGGFVSEASARDPGLTIAALNEWVQDLRMVSSDPMVERRAIDKVYVMIANGSAAQGYINEYFRQNSPFHRSENGTISVEINSILAVSGGTYEVEWTEKSTDTTGQPNGVKRWRGSFTVVTNPPRDELMMRQNPLGMFVTNASWAEQL